MSYVLALALGPVQEFIAAARKARDLWAGSQMLSDCSGAAAGALRGGGATLVFPAPDDLDRGASVVNKIVAIVKDGGAPKALAEAAWAAAQGVLVSRQADAMTVVGGKGAHGTVDTTLMTAQVEDFLEFYAAWHPFADDTGYDDARQKADKLLAGRKAMRDFGPPPDSPGRQKSALDPSRESVLQNQNKDVLARLQIRPTEFLDGVSLVKRTASLRQFASVSRVAVDPFVRRLQRDRPQALAALRDLAEKLAQARDEETPVQRIKGSHLAHYDPFPYDTQLFYDDEPLDEFAEGEERTAAETFRKQVRELRGGLKIGEISPYFALLVADGDRMGKAISALKTPPQHAALSQALSRFAGDVEGIVAGHAGALIYSGGDDVLAFLPLDTALQCADDLRKAFIEALGGLGLDEPPDEPPTLSVGVSIGHFGTALDRLLAWGRGAEHQAKSHSLKKNALAVTLHTRSSGESGIESAASWDDDPVSSRWEKWVKAYREDAIPAGLAYKLRGLAEEVERAAGSGHDTNDLLRAEVSRILTKSRSQRGKENIAAETAKAVLQAIHVPPEEPAVPPTALSPEERAEQTRAACERLKDVVTELLIARHLARAQEIAGRPLAAPGGDR